MTESVPAAKDIATDTSPLPSGEKPVVSIRQVHKTYHAGNIETVAAAGIDLDIFKGEFTSIVGPSGSGKTTVINLIGGLDTADDGTIHVNDKDITAMNESQLSVLRLWDIGFVFQAYNLIPVLTAIENVEYVMLLQGLPEKERTQKALLALEELDIADLKDKRPSQMSGGQQQRVAVARAIASEPALVLADEPTANLDSKTSETLIQYMKKLNHEKGLTFIFASHDPVVVNQARRIVTIKDGHIESDESHE